MIQISNVYITIVELELNQFQLKKNLEMRMFISDGF